MYIIINSTGGDKMSLIELQDYKSNKEYTKDNYYTPIPNAFMRNNKLNMQEKSLYIYFCGFG